MDLIIDCKPGCHTLVGKELDDRGRIVDPERVDWKPASAFVTPPGFWHAHYNESGAPAYLLPIMTRRRVQGAAMCCRRMRRISPTAAGPC